MAHLNSVILGRNLDGENLAQILNIAKLTLTTAAVADNEPMRKGEHDTAISSLDSRLTTVENSSMHLDAVYVDETSPDLVTALSLATWDAGSKHWVFPGGIELATGDLLILNAAAEEEHRSWVMNNTSGGTFADFTPLGSDIDSSIAAAIAALKGDASNQYATLGLIEDVIIANRSASDAEASALDGRITTLEGEMDTAQADILLRPEFKTHTGTFTQNGSNYELEFNNPFGSTAVQIQIQSDEALGSWHFLTDNEIDIHITDTLISVTTASPTIGGHTVRLLMNGIVTP